MILEATAFAVQIMYHTAIQATPGQIVLGYDMILNTPLLVDWEAIRLRKQNIIDKNNQIENKNCKPHIDRIWDKVVVRNKKSK